ncbi:MAG: ABC transporter ATP-binding protein [Clostridia bacterium]|nr:ABC transporter ATP-binding protein [Clostridia bacterium]
MEIKITDLTKIYRSGEQAITALGGVSLSFSAGESVAIVGRSGSGKTTLLNHLCGLDKPDSGSILFDEVEVTHLSPDELSRMRRCRVGVVYQFFNLIPELNIRDNITLPIELDGKEVDEQALSDILKTVGLAGREADFPSALSGGQQQRAAIARALLGQPSLILADEPTGNLDEETGMEILDLLCRLNRKRGITLIVVTHSNTVAARMGRIITLQNGCVVSDEAH